jgi:hypothetical protein
VRVKLPVVLVVLLSLFGCRGDAPLSSQQAVSVVGASTPGPTGTATPLATVAPTPVPTPAPTANPISYVRVGFFGVNCKGGGAPDNGARQLPVGCSGDVTATPKKEDGTDVDSRVHSPNITWDLVNGEKLLDMYDVPNQPFNKHLIGRIPGPFLLCATVGEVMGCLTGQVTP